MIEELVPLHGNSMGSIIVDIDKNCVSSANPNVRPWETAIDGQNPLCATQLGELRFF